MNNDSECPTIDIKYHIYMNIYYYRIITTIASIISNNLTPIVISNILFILLWLRIYMNIESHYPCKPQWYNIFVYTYVFIIYIYVFIIYIYTYNIQYLYTVQEFVYLQYSGRCKGLAQLVAQPGGVWIPWSRPLPSSLGDASRVFSLHGTLW